MVFSDIPYSASFDLGLVPQQGRDIVLSPTPAERAAISTWLGTESVESLTANIRISRKGENRYSYAAHFEADVVQACVVTLEPVRAHLSGDYQRLFQIVPRSSAKRKKIVGDAPGVEISVADEDGPELLDSPIVDLAAPLLEELSLALDPYPRAPGVIFEPPEEPAEPVDNPFAVLERLKTAESDRRGRADPEAVRKPDKKRG